MRQTLRCLGGKVITQPSLQCSPQRLLVARSLVNQQLQILADTAPRENAFTLAEIEPWTLDPSRAQNGGDARQQKVNHTAWRWGIGSAPLVVKIHASED